MSGLFSVRKPTFRGRPTLSDGQRKFIVLFWGEIEIWEQPIDAFRKKFWAINHTNRLKAEWW